MHVDTESRQLRTEGDCGIVVVDDHAIMRDGLRAILNNEPGIVVLGTADDGRAALEIVGEKQPDIVVMDLSMPRTGGAEAIHKIKARYPDIRVVVLTFHKEDATSIPLSRPEPMRTCSRTMDVLTCSLLSAPCDRAGVS